MRKAIALIELIFAIVVIGITLLAVPNLLNTTTKATTNAITQEAVSNGASHLEMIMSQYWDEACVNYDSPILYVKDGDSELEEFNNTKIRVGSNKETPRRFKVVNKNKIYASNAANLGLDSNDTAPDDIDDYTNTSFTLVKYDDAKVDTGEYKDKTVDINTSVFYISDKTNYANSTVTFDNPIANKANKSSNIKAIKVTITSKNDDKMIVFNGFSCNIGSQKLRRRDF